MTAPDNILTMKALSVMQPWAHCIVMGWKPVENRDWKPTNPGLRFRGKVLIHAGKKIDKEFYDALDYLPEVARTVPPPEQLQTGGIVGMTEILDCVRHHDSPWFFGPWAFVFGRARTLPFMPLKGQLGFFNASYDRKLLETTAEAQYIKRRIDNLKKDMVHG